MAHNDLHLQLGDIIEIIAPEDEKLHEKNFFINYIDNNEIDLLDDDGSIILMIGEDKSLLNESITEIRLLDRASEQGYSRQNGLLPDTWVNVYLGGEIPVVVTGKITNLEEDQIEITSVEEGSEPIYIDFEYKGVPKDIPIDKIEIRDPPEHASPENASPEHASPEHASPEHASPEHSSPEHASPEHALQEHEGEYRDIVDSPEEQDMGKIIQDKIFDADQFKFGDELDEISQIIDVADENKKFSIDKQTGDILDDLLSDIPNKQRTPLVLNHIHTLIERYVQLREKFSTFDDYNNVDGFIKRGPEYKPLTNVLKEQSHKLYWVLPVVKCKKHIYDVDAPESTDGMGVSHMELSVSRARETELINSYEDNTIAGENRYYALIKGLNKFYTPFDEPDNRDTLLTTQRVNANVLSVVENLDNFESTVFKNKDIHVKRFYTQEYNVGINTIKYTKTKGGRGGVELTNHKLTESDPMSIKSYITLPEPAVLFSHINLPTTNIMTRANLNRNFLSYWRLLTERTDISTKIISRLDRPGVMGDTFLNKFTEHILDEDVQDPDKYEKFLKIMVPTTADLFELIKNNITDNLSIHGILKYLEPFMIYKEDLTYSHYAEFNSFIAAGIFQYKKAFIEKRDKMAKTLRKFRTEEPDIPYLLTILPEDEKIAMLALYGLENTPVLTNHTFLKYISEIDNSNYYNTLLAKTSFSLMVPYATEQVKRLDELSKSASPASDQSDGSPASLSPASLSGASLSGGGLSGTRAEDSAEPGECEPRVLAKKYLAIDEMTEDNDKAIYFDKQYDKTYYELISEYKKYISDETLSLQDKILILTNKLKDSVGLSTYNATIEATALIEKKREVREGNYCVVVIDDEDTKYLYYKRVGGNWERDATITGDVFSDKSKTFCNLSQNCIDIKNTCETLENSEKIIKNKNLIMIVKEFDVNMQEGLEEIKKKIEDRLSLYSLRLPKLINLQKTFLYKYNDQKYTIGIGVEEFEGTVSPYIKIRDTILGFPDFSQRQNFILQFDAKYARPASKGEDNWWKYCIETNVKLLPTFILELASSFVEGNDYMTTVKKICKQQGTYSDDGGSWVDKHSGYFITYIKFDEEEGYDEGGFKQVSRDVLEKDAGAFVMQETRKSIEDKYTNPITKKIYNVVTTMADYMDIAIEPYLPGIIHDTMQKLKVNLPNKEQAEKGKKGAYAKQVNSLLIMLSLCYFLISVQTSIPSLKPRKGFPGCKMSFSGYPLHGEEDLTGISYISCVLKKISKSATSPWNAVAKQKLENINIIIKKILDEYVLIDRHILDKITAKLKYLSKTPEDAIPADRDIRKWHTFLPPLNQIELGVTEPVTKLFEKELLTDFKKGTSSQSEKLLVLQSKSIYFSLHIQKLINKTIKESAAILTNNAGVPYLVNSCCDDGTINAIDYLMEKEPNIRILNKRVENLTDSLREVRTLTKANILFYPTNTKPTSLPISTEFSEETIYQSFIAYCRFNTSIPIDEELRAICLEKPGGIGDKETLQDKIRALKQEGRNYTIEDLHMLITIINKRNVVDIQLENIAEDNIISLYDLVNSLAEYRTDAVPGKFLTDITSLLEMCINQTQNLKYYETSAYRDMIDYLVLSNSNMRMEINRFITRNTKKRNKDVTACIDSISSFNVLEKTRFIGGGDETTFKQLDFIKNTIRLISDVFPNIIINKVNPCGSGCKIPKHWKLSEFHNRDMMNILGKFYKNFNSLFDDETVVTVMKESQRLNKTIYKLVEKTLYYSENGNAHTDGSNIFNAELCVMLHEYYLLSTFSNIISAMDGITEFNIKPRDDDFDAMVDDDSSLEQQLLSGDIENKQGRVAALLSTFCTIITENKKVIDYNYTMLMDRVHRAKEKEKDGITDYLKAMTDEEREIESLFKNQKLEKWSTGLQKGFRNYDGKTYDTERNAMEMQAIAEHKLGENSMVTEMNKDIFMMDLMEQEAISEEIESAEYSLQHLADDDDYGDRDGDEGY